MRFTRHAHHACRCTHARSAHEHYRSGSDCGICGPQACSKFHASRSARPLAPVLDLVPATEVTTFPATSIPLPVSAAS